MSPKVTRDELLKKAAVYFASAGVRPASIQEIARAIGVPRSTLYYHFKSQQDLFYEFLVTSLSLLTEKVAEVATYPVPAGDRLRIMIRVVLWLHDSDPAVEIPLRGDERMLSDGQRDTCAKMMIAYQDVFTKVISEGIAAGEFRRVDPRLATFMVLGVLWDSWSWYSRDGALSSETIADVFADVFLVGLRASASDD